MKTWTDGQVAVLQQMWGAGAKRLDICAALGKTIRAVSGKATAMKLGGRPGIVRRTPELVAKVRELRSRGTTWAAIGKIIGADPITVYRWADWVPAFHEENFKARLLADRDAVELMKIIPPDTRTLTARLCGDPLPGRDALSKKIIHNCG